MCVGVEWCFAERNVFGAGADRSWRSMYYFRSGAVRVYVGVEMYYFRSGAVRVCTCVGAERNVFGAEADRSWRSMYYFRSGAVRVYVGVEMYYFRSGAVRVYVGVERWQRCAERIVFGAESEGGYQFGS